MSYYDVSFMFRNLSAYLSLHHKIPLISHLGNKPIHVHHLFGFHLFHQRIDGDEATCSSNASAVKKTVSDVSFLSYKEEWMTGGLDQCSRSLNCDQSLQSRAKSKIRQSELKTISSNSMRGKVATVLPHHFAFNWTKARRTIRFKPITKLSTDNCS